jgi:hypothetical protein
VISTTRWATLAICLSCSTTNPARTSQTTALQTDAYVSHAVAAVSAERLMDDVRTLVGFKTRNSCSTQTSPTMGIGAARAFLRSRFAALPGMKVAIDRYDQTTCGGRSVSEENIVAWLPGRREPNRVIVIGGHYDSRGDSTRAATNDGTIAAPGANDSGSQTALLLEAARTLAQAGPADATIVFVAFAGEEQGLLGSASFVDDYRSVLGLPAAHVEAMLDCDIVGGDSETNDTVALTRFRVYAPGTPREVGGDPRAPELQGTSDDTSPARGIMRYVHDWASVYVPVMKLDPHLRQDRPGRGGDHQPFLDQGIPAVRFIETVENLAHQHSPEDLPEYVTPAYLAHMTQVVLATAASLAQAPAPPHALAVTAAPGGTLALSFAAPEGAPVHHYVVAARHAGENFYRARVATAGPQLSASVPASALGIQPPYFVSVAAVDAAGHESPFAYPELRCDVDRCSVQFGSEQITVTQPL